MARTFKALFMACLLLAVPAGALAYTADAPFVTDLIAGGGNDKAAIDIGDVLVWNDDDNLYVKYTVIDGWCVTETQLQVALSLEGIPQTRSGNPVPGKFTFKGAHACVGDYTGIIPLPDDLAAEIFMAAHASAIGTTGDGIVSHASAWGNGTGFPGKNWATYFTLSLQTDAECPCFTTSSLCAAFASECGNVTDNLCGDLMVLGDANMEGLMWRSPWAFSFYGVYAAPSACTVQTSTESSLIGATTMEVSACEEVLQKFDPALCVEY